MLLIERANRVLESKNIKSVSISKILILKLFYGPGFENCLVARLLISKMHEKCNLGLLKLTCANTYPLT